MLLPSQSRPDVGGTDLLDPLILKPIISARTVVQHHFLASHARMIAQKWEFADPCSTRESYRLRADGDFDEIVEVKVVAYLGGEDSGRHL